MPHLVVELSPDLDTSTEAHGLLPLLHEAAATTGILDPADLKIRTLPCSRHLVGGAAQPFAHVWVHLLEGRTTAAKRSLATALLAALVQTFASVERLSVDVRDMDDGCYRKRPYGG